jgi:hypothetical protein
MVDGSPTAPFRVAIRASATPSINSPGTAIQSTTREP